MKDAMCFCVLCAFQRANIVLGYSILSISALCAVMQALHEPCNSAALVFMFYLGNKHSDQAHMLAFLDTFREICPAHYYMYSKQVDFVFQLSETGM